jgi:predicted deacylase
MFHDKLCTRLKRIGVLLCGSGVVFLPPALRAAQDRMPFRIGSVVAEPSTTAIGRLDVPSGPDGTTFIPITIVHGRQTGPVLALIAGVHGAETSPILALQQLPARLHPQRMTGTVVLVHVANIPSFLGRTIYVSPIDRKNLNRLFPGKKDGTITERIAHTLTSEIISRSDYVIDIHSGDANEDLRPWTGFYAKYGSPETIRASREMAVAFGIDFIVEFPFVPANSGETVYTGPTAVGMGKPSFDVEVGRMGLIEPKNLTTILEGLMSVMRHLRMLDGEPNPAKQPWFITRRINLAADQDGLFYPVVHAGDFVPKGTSLGYLTDFHARRTQEVVAPESGAVLSIFATPAANKGDTLVVLAATSGS